MQDSTKESPFYLLYDRDPRLPTASDLALPRPAYTLDLDDYKTEVLPVWPMLENMQDNKYSNPRRSRSYSMIASRNIMNLPSLFVTG